MLIVKAILLGLLSMFANAEYFFGTTLWSRPIITGPLVGLILGDLKSGIIIGATLELAFIGAIAIGAAGPPDINSGGVLGTAFAISTGQGPEVALALCLPIATLILVIKNFLMVFLLPLFAHKADKYAEQANFKGISIMHIAGGFFTTCLPTGLIVASSFYLGSPFMESILNKIPQFVQSGLTIATGILPALGFALLARMIMNKKVAIFFFLGFTLSVYLKIPVTGIAILGVILAFILVDINRKIPMKTASVGGDDDDF